MVQPRLGGLEADTEVGRTALAIVEAAYAAAVETEAKAENQNHLNQIEPTRRPVTSVE